MKWLYRLPRITPGQLFFWRRELGMAALLVVSCLPALLLALSDAVAFTPDEHIVIIAGSAFGLALLVSPHGRFPRCVITGLILVALLALAECAFILEYGAAIDANALSLIAESNPAEAAELLTSMPGSTLVGAGAIFALGCLAWPNAARLRSWPGKKLAVYSLIGLSTIGIISSTAGAAAFTDGNPFPVPSVGQAQAIRSAFPAGLIYVTADFINEREALKQAHARNQNFRFGAQDLSPKTPHRRVYVMVIGETSRADRWSINGYTRETTPRLRSRAGLISFKRMFSPRTFSRLAVPLLISRKPPELSSALFDEASIVTAFKEAGFHTTWISLQAPVGFHESPISIHAYEADDVRFLNPADYRTHGKHDSAAIPELRKIMAEQSLGDTFVVIHTLGSHFRYTDRYPQVDAQFLPDRNVGKTTRLFDPDDREVLSNSYDNSILFTDRVLDELITSLDRHRDVESWLFYASDHGEALFDDCRMLSGHGQFAKQTQSVAAVFWASPLFSTQHGRQLAAMRGNANALASTAMGFETLASLADLNIPRNRNANSLAEAPLRQPAEVLEVGESGPVICDSNP